MWTANKQWSVSSIQCFSCSHSMQIEKNKCRNVSKASPSVLSHFLITPVMSMMTIQWGRQDHTGQDTKLRSFTVQTQWKEYCMSRNAQKTLSQTNLRGINHLKSDVDVNLTALQFFFNPHSVVWIKAIITVPSFSARCLCTCSCFNRNYIRGRK